MELDVCRASSVYCLTDYEGEHFAWADDQSTAVGECSEGLSSRIDRKSPKPHHCRRHSASNIHQQRPYSRRKKVLVAILLDLVRIA